VFVALDEDGRPRPIPPIVVDTEVQQRRQREAKIRRETRLAHREAIATHRREVGAEGSGTMGGA
jgi:hypothetical protein